MFLLLTVKEAVVVTTDAVGRQVTTSVPFYISNTLLKPGLFDYSLSLGKIREDYGLKNFSYGKFASAADARYGVNDWLTVEGRTELSSDLQLLGAGSVLKLANLGVLSASLPKVKPTNLCLKIERKTWKVTNIQLDTAITVIGLVLALTITNVMMNILTFHGCNIAI